MIDRCLLASNTSPRRLHLLLWPHCRNSVFAGNGGDGMQLNADNSGQYTYLDYCTFAANAGAGYQDIHNSQWPVYITNCVSSSNGTFGVRKAGAGYSGNDYISFSCVYGNPTNIQSDTAGKIVIQEGMITNQHPQFAPGGFTLGPLSPCLKRDEYRRLRGPDRSAAADEGRVRHGRLRAPAAAGMIYIMR